MKHLRLLFVFALGFLLAAPFGWAQNPPASDDQPTSPRPQRGQPLYQPDQVLVRFRPNVSAPAIAQAHAALGGQVLRAYSSRLPGLQLVRIPAGMTVREAVRAYRTRPEVLYAEPNYIVRTQITPNDPRLGDLWGLHNTGQAGGTADADIDAPEAWDLTTGSSNVVVFVIDTGVDFNHQDLAANMIQLESNCSDGLDNDGNGFIDDCRGIDTFNNDTNPFDDHGHGTHVSGTIGAVGNNGVGVVGVNWTVRLGACKFLGGDGFGFTAGAVACLDYVAGLKDMGVNIVATNNSWGGGGFSQALQDAIAANGQRGILFIAAAGNAALDNDAFDFFPADYYLPNVIAVAAMNRFDLLAGFSNFGRHTVHLAAPGEEVLSSTPGNTYSFFNGTSMATPHVTGVAALLKAQDPNRDWIAIKNLLLAGGVSVNSYSETITGKRLNAHGALTCADSTVLSRLRPVRDSIPGKVGEPLDLAVLHIKCAAPNGNVDVTVQPGGSTITLLDDGNGPDQEAGDGIYSGQFTPTEGGFPMLEFPDGSTVTVLIPSDQPFVLFDLESEAGFTATQFGAVMNWLSTTNRGNDPGHSATTSFYFGDPARMTYNCGTDQTLACHEAGLLMSPPINLGPGPHLLAFNYFLDSEPFVDLAAAYAFDGNDFFLLLDNFGGGLENNTGQWHQAVADLSPFAGQTIQIAFYFDTFDEFFNDFEGHYVDDVLVDGQNIGLSAAGASVPEGESGTTPLDFTVRLSRASQDTITVNFATADGTATAPADYQAASGMLTFMPGETLKTVTVQVVGDTVKEPDETFFLELSGATNAVVALSPATGVILRDEPNNPPVADAGANQTVQATSESGASVQLNGSASSDPDGDPLTFIWTAPFGTVATTSPTATMTVPIGSHVITLVVNDGFSDSAPAQVTVNVSHFFLTADPPSRTVMAGQSATFTITGMPEFGPFNSSVTLSCAGALPRGVSCSFSPSNMLTPGAGGASVTLTVTTTAPRFAELRPPSEQRPTAPVHALWLGLLFGLALVTGPRGKRRLAALVLVLGLAAALAGCGGGGGSSGPTLISGTPTGTHSISVSAASGSLQRGVDIQLVVQ